MNILVVRQQRNQIQSAEVNLSHFFKKMNYETEYYYRLPVVLRPAYVLIKQNRSTSVYITPYKGGGLKIYLK
jgi:hypothetical protein